MNDYWKQIDDAEKECAKIEENSNLVLLCDEKWNDRATLYGWNKKEICLEKAGNYQCVNVIEKHNEGYYLEFKITHTDQTFKIEAKFLTHFFSTRGGYHIQLMIPKSESEQEQLCLIRIKKKYKTYVIN